MRQFRTGSLRQVSHSTMARHRPDQMLQLRIAQMHVDWRCSVPTCSHAAEQSHSDDEGAAQAGEMRSCCSPDPYADGPAEKQHDPQCNGGSAAVASQEGHERGFDLHHEVAAVIPT